MNWGRAGCLRHRWFIGSDKKKAMLDGIALHQIKVERLKESTEYRRFSSRPDG